MITTVTTVTTLGLSAIISMAMVVSLMVFLATRELAGASRSRFSLRVVRFASVGILHLFMAFATIVTIKIVELL
jgi:hypothetical protein